LNWQKLLHCNQGRINSLWAFSRTKVFLQKSPIFIDSPSTSHYISTSVSGTFSGSNRMNIAVFASGRGSNFQAILKAIDSGSLPARVVLAISNNANAGALELARSREIRALHISEKMFSSNEAYAKALITALKERKIEVIALAGFLKKMPTGVIRQWRNRVVNIHPALLPSFGGTGMYGHHVHEAVIESGVKFSGATVHFVDEEYDRGPILLQKTVAVTKDDTPDTLAAKVLKIEHEIYPLALKAIAEQRVTIDGNKAWIMQ
jgi:phosphoribosylglycinamide formyltransferase 1